MVVRRCGSVQVYRTGYFSQGQPGIIPRLCNNLFERIETVSGPENQTKVEVSYMEIYNEKVFDLLDLTSTNKAGLKVREHNVLGPYVDGLGQLAVISYQVSIVKNCQELSCSRSRSKVRSNLRPFLCNPLSFKITISNKKFIQWKRKVQDFVCLRVKINLRVSRTVKLVFTSQHRNFLGL